MKETFEVQKASLILTRSLIQMKILVLMMLLIGSLMSNATKQYQIDQNQRTYMYSQRHCLVFMLAFQRIIVFQRLLQPKNVSEKKKPFWSNSHTKKHITGKLCNELSSIHKMSLQEVHSIWAVQYKYHNFATNYKMLQRKIETNLSQLRIDSNHQNHTLLNSSKSAKKTSIKQDESKKPLHGPVVQKKLPQWNTKYCLASSVCYEL